MMGMGDVADNGGHDADDDGVNGGAQKAGTVWCILVSLTPGMYVPCEKGSKSLMGEINEGMRQPVFITSQGFSYCWSFPGYITSRRRSMSPKQLPTLHHSH